MSGKDKDKDLDLGAVDWDAALTEWEEKTFLPETAKDRETSQPGTLQGTPAPPPVASPSARPLYVPPKVSSGRPPPSVAEPASTRETRDPADEGASGGEEESNATVISKIPRELLRRESGAPSRAGAGLGQMFAKAATDRPIADLENAPTASSLDEESAIQVASLLDDASVVTSAKELAALRSRQGPSNPPPRVKAMAIVDPAEAVPEGEMFDPFAEPDPFAKPAPKRESDGPQATVESIEDEDYEEEAEEGREEAAPIDAKESAGDIEALLGSTEEIESVPIDLTPGPSLLQPGRRVFDADTETSGHVRGAIHAPARREYDPNEETSILSKAAFRAKLEEVESEDDPTRFRTRGEAAAPKTTQSWADERPARAALSDEARNVFAARAEWLESEARATDDRTSRARTLLVASEIRAIIGDLESAEMLAREAAATAPTLAMAPRQARSLTFIGQPDADASGALRPREPTTMAEALDAEARQSPTQAAMLHDALLAADVLRASGDADGAAKRWDRAIRIAPADPRAPIARAADRIARGDLQHPTLRLPDAVELAPFAEAFARALKIRGVERSDVQSDAALGNDALRRAREALDARDLARAASAINEVARIGELRDAAAWLAASLGAVSDAGRAESVEAFRNVAKSGAARRAIAARAMELGTPELIEEALASAPDDAFTPADRAVLAVLTGQEATADDLDALASSTELAPLGAALAASGAPPRRAYRVAGIARSRDIVRLARLVSSGASREEIDEALEAFAGEHDGETRAVALEMAARAGNAGEVSDAILAWTGGDDEDEARDRSLAAGLVAERAGDVARASAAYASAFALDSASEAALRAVAALDPATDVAEKLRGLADERREGPGAALARLEAVARVPEASDADRAALLEAAHAAAPELPIASFFAERAARRAGDVDAVLRCIRERRASNSSTRDPIESALDDVREALLVADTDQAVAAERLAEAHRARPMDVALRELFERVAGEAAGDRATWREARAAQSTSSLTKARLLLEAVHEHERLGDTAAALRDAELAHAASGDGLSRLALERAEIAAGSTSRLAESLLTLARSTTDARERREAYERLADLDATGRGDAASALLWHRTILEESPDYAPSLRYVEHALMSGGRVDDLEPVAAAIARMLAASGGAEAPSHAQLAARLRMRGAAGEWEPTRPMVDLAMSASEPSLWALRSLAAHARSSGDDASLVRACLALAERTTRSPEIAALVARAGEGAMRTGDLERARELLERAATEDPGDVFTWGLLVELRQKLGDARGAAEASESLARTSSVEEHRLLAWYEAARLLLDDANETGDEERGIAALEEAARIDVGYADVFSRLSALYTKRGQRHELAALLERRLEGATDEDDRVRLEVERARALADVGETEAARQALASALALRADHVGALGALADLCAQTQDWEAAEQAWVRLARLLPDPLDQRDVYARLGELYAEHAVNLSRAEVALKEVLKRAPDDVTSLERLVGVYKRQNDGVRALETAQQLLKMAVDPVERRERLVEIASIHETVTKDLRKAEQALEAARREFPNDVGALRALAEFYQRQRQLPAVNILLDRASADARRALAAGKFATAHFEVLEAVFELRGKSDAARVVAGSLAAMHGEPASVQPAGGRAGDPRLDEGLAPEALGGAFRALLLRAGDALDAATALDLRALHASLLPPGVAQSRVAAIASSLGVPPVQVLVSPQLGRGCVPSASNPPSIVIGEGMVSVIGEPAAAFAITRALKLVQAHASALVRTPPADLVVLVAAWLQTLNPSWSPQGIAKEALASATRRIQAGMPKNVDPEAATIALEVAATLGPHLAHLGASTIAWADRVALLAVGDANAALDAIAWSLGLADGAPRAPDQRAYWAVQTGEARDLLIFSTSDAFAAARARAGISG